MMFGTAAGQGNSGPQTLSDEHVGSCLLTLPSTCFMHRYCSVPLSPRAHWAESEWCHHCSPSMHKVICLIYLLDPLQCWPRCEDSWSQHLGLASLALKAQLSQY